MKPNYLIRVSLIVCIVLLCTGFAVYSFMRLDAMDERRDFNLYTLIPQDVEAVFETDRVTELIEQIDAMACSRDNQFLYVSDLFSCVKKFLRVLIEKEPHGLSWEMNEMLISFHNPDLKNDQVLYCRLGIDDRKLLESYISRSAVSGYSSKTFAYKGQVIDIYPLSDGRFLTVWMQRDFLVVSFQKRLIERVIDTWKQKKSLARLDVFRSVSGDRREENKAVVYARWKPSSYLMETGVEKSHWLSFNLKFAEEGIYCAGLVNDDVATDTCCQAFFCSPPLDSFLGDELPRSTFLYKVYALSATKTEMRCFLQHIEADSVPVTAESVAFDEALAKYFQLEAGNQVLSCFFHSSDSLDRQCRTILSIPMKNAARAQWELHKLLYAAFQGRYPFYKSFTVATGVAGLRLFRLPEHRLTTRLAGCSDGLSFTCACFYKGRLLLSSDEQDLSEYITSLEQNDVLEAVPLYGLATDKLAPTYHSLLMTDMGEALFQSKYCRDLLPPFFLAHANFFRHFQLSIQLCYTEGVVYPNLVLLYTYPDLSIE